MLKQNNSRIASHAYFPLFSYFTFLFIALSLHAADYKSVDTIFAAHCLDCHDSKEPEAKLVLENFTGLMKGGESGAVIVPGKSGESILVQMVEGTYLKDGKKLVMPPKKNQKKLDAAEIATLKDWIDAGAQGPADGQEIVKELVVPMIAPHGTPRDPVNCLAHSPATKLIAVGRYGIVELRWAEKGKLIRTLPGHKGNINSLAFSPDGKTLYAASGETGVFGEIKQWNVHDGKLVNTLRGHKDTIYSIALSPDGKTLASGSYDQKIILWDTATGKELKTLSGHNGCIYDLAFRPDGKILASASGDHTVKLWDVASGTRRDTLSQPLKDVYAVAFSPDGKQLLAGGMDNRIRIWQISDEAKETTNPILDSKFAHEGTILRLVFSSDGKMLLSSADDNTVKLWNAVTMKEKFVLEKQPDWAAGLDFALDNSEIVTGRLDGSIGFYDTSNGKFISNALARTGNKNETLATK